MFGLWNTYHGDQWSIGDWHGMIAAAPTELHPWLAGLYSTMAGEGPPQYMKEYDPEWGRAFWTGTVAASCDHARMLAAVKVPVLLTHHFHTIDEETGFLMGPLSDRQAERARQLVTDADQPVDHRSFPTIGRSMHGQDPQLFTDTLTAWTQTLS